jgi:hypothetical protein
LRAAAIEGTFQISHLAWAEKDQPTLSAPPAHRHRCPVHPLPSSSFSQIFLRASRDIFPFDNPRFRAVNVSTDQKGNLAMSDESVSARSEAQRAAARENGKKSCGPKTADGKAQSRKNALKHGMASRGVVMPEALERHYLTELELFIKDQRPQNHTEQRLVEQAAFASARHAQLMRAEVEATRLRLAAAPRNWDAARAEAVAQMAGALEPYQPGLAAALRQLRQTSHGCRVLARCYRRFITHLELGGDLDSGELDRFFRLQGRPGYGGGPGDPALIHELLRLVAAVRWRYADKYDRSTLAGRLGKSAAELDAAPPPEADARATLLEFCREKRQSLVRRARYLEKKVDVVDRGGAMDLALFDGSHEGALRSRYLVEAARATRGALSELRRMRKEARSTARDAEQKPRQFCRNEPEPPAYTPPQPPPPTNSQSPQTPPHAASWGTTAILALICLLTTPSGHSSTAKAGPFAAVRDSRCQGTGTKAKLPIARPDASIAHANGINCGQSGAAITSAVGIIPRVPPSSTALSASRCAVQHWMAQVTSPIW